MNMEKMVNYCKNYGFIFQGSEIYGGLSNTFDYGPLGVELKNNLKNAWLKRFIQEDINCVKLDSAILMNPKVWEASGHLKTFSDPLIDCKECNSRYRADKLLEDNNVSDVEKMTSDDMINYIKDNHIKCTMWSGVAENTSEYCKQGDLIGIKGRIQTRVIEKDNSKQTIQEVIAEKVTFLAKSKEKTDDEIEI